MSNLPSGYNPEDSDHFLERVCRAEYARGVADSAAEIERLRQAIYKEHLEKQTLCEEIAELKADAVRKGLIITDYRNKWDRDEALLRECLEVINAHASWQPSVIICITKLKERTEREV
jgi:hypothetical protein